MEVITETSTYETVFNGEAKDPVTGNLYQYNSKSGARKWKVPQEPIRNNLDLTSISSVSQSLSPEKNMPMKFPKDP
uniref:cadherin-related family member 3-like n=2 Tax=Podarcis TaxID=42163 RepID=UPI0010A0BC36|nr:cadherin-related family member 3-like [Podarcis muralis]